MTVAPDAALTAPLDAHSATPPFVQVKRRISEAAASGSLVVGARLPPVRELAGRLGVAANTVARAYRELEQEGVVETRGRGGSFIAAADATQQQAASAAADFAERADALGLGRADALALVAAALDARGVV
jgi:DNA-binding transcriptional regulator YhcF (GntR family)